MNLSLGIIEVEGLVTATACMDAMVKSAFVNVHHVEQVGSGWIAIMITGDLASVQAALERGAEVAQYFGEVVAVRTIPRPYQGLEPLITPVEKVETHEKV
ncbi:BMC domain-containing protein [Caldalkalibacillus thermarum TA2.A1]|uniref:BMC domain-containing protein n=1 Tax=Caldalkalibacillus thermarum (strain TA2.A1) TaxID=986075 RepID=A0A8X8LBT7_CALTT|nr:BMC domain-containing protein [Caldalkalibacillus thermarum]QZT35258.1 BMC domain-containing protein [Caldalkalibacillus thermarum TA2.A1]GGK30356.1 carboxysome shell protein [Caldalkalibacillus thermarum]